MSCEGAVADGELAPHTSNPADFDGFTESLTCKMREENNGMDIIVSAMIGEGYHSNYALKE